MRTLGVVLIVANVLFALFDIAALYVARDGDRKYFLLSLLCAVLSGSAGVLLIVSNP